jgi:diguanylate cyclase (GGDEF)-like protein
MRKGRFSTMIAAAGGGAGRPLSLARLITFDVSVPADEDDRRIAAERIAALRISIPLLLGSHILWSALLLAALWQAGLRIGGVVPALLVAVLALDAALWRLVPRLSPHHAARLTVAHTALTLGLWAAVAVAAGPGPLAVRATIIAGAGSCLPIFFTLPGLVLLGAAATSAIASLLGVEDSLLGVGWGLGAFLSGLSLLRGLEQVSNARRRLAGEEEARKARRFVADFEESGRGWFWETDVDGALVYVSGQFARQAGLDSAALLGRRFEDVLLAGAGEAGGKLDFPLSARFPFEDFVVRAAGSEGTWWSLSGNPTFDAYGRFLGFRGIGTNLTEQRRSEAEASKLAHYDSLTGLANRAMMRSTLDTALANAAERHQGCALMLIDLDRFKQVNDTLGHPIGDKLLKQVAERLRGAVGEAGQVGRLGGDEFEAILPGLAEEGPLGALALNVIEQVSRPYRIEGHRISVGASVGIAIARPGKAYAAALIKEADLALYAAKDAGRGTFRVFAAEMHDEATDRQILARDLADALARDQLKLLFQPIVDSVSEEVVAFEALLRWHHPTRGVLPPALILPLASDSGLMPRIGAWVLRSACAQAAAWPAHVRVSVNLSPSEFSDAALASTVTGALAGSGLDPERLELEISEEVFLADSAASEQVLTRLKGIGVRLALDNFGTGHSGLGHLRNAPLDKIKIDRSFVRGASERGSRNAAIVRAIVVLAESLGIDTTAEGAETMDELALIRRLGCSQVQGFLFGKPMLPSEADALARESRPPSEVVGFSRPPRHRLIRVGTIEVDGVTLPVRLRNISAGGAMVECERTLAPETPVRLDLEQAGKLDAQVRWSQRGQAGVKFTHEFALRKLARLRRPAVAQTMLTPQYLEPGTPAAPAPALGPSPLARKRRGGAR